MFADGTVKGKGEIYECARAVSEERPCHKEEGEKLRSHSGNYTNREGARWESGGSDGLNANVPTRTENATATGHGGSSSQVMLFTACRRADDTP